MLEKSRNFTLTFKEIQYNSEQDNWQCGYMNLLCGAYKYSMGQHIEINKKKLTTISDTI